MTFAVFNAFIPTAVLYNPVVRESSVLKPTATFLLPEVFAPRASCPTAVLYIPVVLASRVEEPTAVFSEPVVFAAKAT